MHNNDHNTKINNPHDDGDCHIDNKYNKQTISWIQITYIAALLGWIFLVWALDLLKEDLWVILLLFIPVVAFIINFISLGEYMCDLDKVMFKGNFLYFGFIVAIILINWENPVEVQDKTNYFQIIITAFILLMISMVDLWVGKDAISVVKNIRTSLHTISLSLLAVALYLYYIYHRDSYDIHAIKSAKSNGFIKAKSIQE